MATFWLWGVRNPCVLLAGLVTASGLAGVADWSITMAIIMMLALTAEAASIMARRARARRDRERAAREALLGASAIRQRFREAEAKRAA